MWLVECVLCRNCLGECFVAHYAEADLGNILENRKVCCSEM